MDERERTVFTEQERGILAGYRRPRSPDWGLRSPALLVVDVVESFVGPDLPVVEAQRECRTACGEHAWRAIESIVPLLAAFRRRGDPVAFSTIAQFPSLPQLPAQAHGPGDLRADMVVEPLSPVEGELVLAKVRPSAFFGTPLLTWLMLRGVDQVVVVGGATSGCVRATVLDAYSHGLEVLLPHDGCFDRVTTSHVVSLVDLDTKYARVVNAPDVVVHLLDG